MMCKVTYRYYYGTVRHDILEMFPFSSQHVPFPKNYTEGMYTLMFLENVYAVTPTYNLTVI